jgi:RNA recognition motif-containing protein
MGLDLHKRKIFIQYISPQTTTSSLKDYFAKYPIEWCKVPVDDAGKNKKHGMVVFRNEQSVDDVMSQREHQIDGKVVFIHRSLPMQQSSKDKIGIQQLIVSSLNNQSLTESKIRNYFNLYGKILHISTMRNDHSIWVINFD